MDTEDPDAPIPTLTAVEQLRQKVRDNVRVSALYDFLEDVITRRLDEERELLAKLALELEVSPVEPLILAGGKRSGVAGAALAASTVMKRRFSKVCRDRMQLDEHNDNKSRPPSKKTPIGACC